MIKTYITKTGQNLYDICMTLYGSVEGMLDLLVCNTSLDITEYGPSELSGKPLTLTTTLSRGIKLRYHTDLNINDTVLRRVGENTLSFRNGEHSLDIAEIDPSKIIMVVDQRGIMSTIRASVLIGEVYIDWGDFSNVDVISSNEIIELEHVYNSPGSHNIKIYGDPIIFKTLDISKINGIAYPTTEIRAAEYIPNTDNDDLNHLIIVNPEEGGWFILDKTPIDTAYIK